MQRATYARRSRTGTLMDRGEGKAHRPLPLFAIAPSGSQVLLARQAEAERRSPLLCVLGHEVTTLGPRELSGDGEPETRTGAFAAGAGCLRPVEAIEDTG